MIFYNKTEFTKTKKFCRKKQLASRKWLHKSYTETWKLHRIQEIFAENVLSPLYVRWEINFVGKLGDVDLEPLLHFIQDLGVGLVAHHCDRQSLDRWIDRL